MVSADPKSKTGEQDRKELMKLYESHWQCWRFTHSPQDLRKWGELCPSCDVPTARNSRLRWQYDAYVSVIQIWSCTNKRILAYDIKLLVNKGTVDIVRPQWLLDCVARDELVPLKKKYSIKGDPSSVPEAHKLHRYFFHASDDRQMSAEYNERDSEGEEMDDKQEPSREQGASPNIPTTPEGIEPKVEPAEDVDPALADWLSVDARHTVTEDSATEPESDADSSGDDIDKDTDEWIAVEPSGSETLESFDVLVSPLISTYVASGTHVFIT